jgi:hypothetical protein
MQERVASRRRLDSLFQWKTHEARPSFVRIDRRPFRRRIPTDFAGLGDCAERKAARRHDCYRGAWWRGRARAFAATAVPEECELETPPGLPCDNDVDCRRAGLAIMKCRRAFTSTFVGRLIMAPITVISISMTYSVVAARLGPDLERAS